MYVRGAPRVEEDVALTHAGLGLQQPVDEQRFADRLGELAVVAGEPTGQMRELRVVAAPLPHAVEPLQDPPGDPPRRVGVVVRARGRFPGCVEERLLELLDRGRVGRHASERRDARGGAQRVAVADGLAQVGCRELRHDDRTGSQAVDACELVLEGDRDELGVGAGRVQRQVPVELPDRERLRVRAGGDQRADEGGDQRPCAIVHGGGVGPQLRRDGRDRRAAGRNRDCHRPLVARALARELPRPVLQLGTEQRAQLGRRGTRVGERVRERIHRPYRIWR
jgi:hypothetical protein